MKLISSFFIIYYQIVGRFFRQALLPPPPPKSSFFLLYVVGEGAGCLLLEYAGGAVRMPCRYSRRVIVQALIVRILIFF